MNHFFTIPWEHNVKNNITRRIPVDKCLVIIFMIENIVKNLGLFLEIFTYLDFLEYQLVIYVARKIYRHSNQVVLMQVHRLGRLQFFVTSIACCEIESFYSPAMAAQKEDQ